MSEVTHYLFSWTEVAEVLVRKQGIQEGEWVATIEFAINAGVLGQIPADAKPGILLLANGVQLLKAPPNSPPHLVVNAAEVNPKS